LPTEFQYFVDYLMTGDYLLYWNSEKNVHDGNNRLLTPANEIKYLPMFATHAIKYFDE
jgi:hypothetical protein